MSHIFRVRTIVSLSLAAALSALDSPSAQQAFPSVSSAPAVPLAAYQDLKWRMVGPTRGGRVTAIAGVRTQPCTYYFGGVGGGVWKTDTCGHEWRPVSDGQIETGSIGSIDVAPSNPDIVYVGTGSAAIRSNVIIGRGIYKSTDAGRTWQFLGLKEAGQIGEVAVHPTNPDVAWAAALGSPFGPTEERGIFKTSDGGKTWRKVLFVNPETGARTVAINPSNPDEVYAAMYRGFRKGWDIISGGPATEGGIYKSVDGGEKWTKLSQGLPQKLIGKIDLAVARSNPRVVYAMVEAPGAEGGLYRTDDGGGTWRVANNEQRLRARPFYFHYVDVNPKNENEVWINELGLHKSVDGGKTFARVATPHGDNHGIWFNPDNPSYAVQCNDGGANVTTDGGRTWSSILNQPTAELYMVAVDNQFPYRLYAPQQDNSTLIIPAEPPHAGGWDHPAQAWQPGPGCETGQIHPRPDGSVVWGACKGEVERYSAATGQSKGTWIYPQNRYGHDPDDVRYRFPRQTVIHVSPHDPKTVYQASHVVHRTINEGESWDVISGDLTAREPDKQIVPGSPITRDITGEEVYSSIYSMTESRLERGVLWVGANDGPVHVSRDGGKAWKKVTPPDLGPGGRVQTVEDSPHRKGSAYISVYRYLREHDLKPYVYVTNDYGATWTKLTDGANGIPADYPVRVVREDTEVPGLLYAGTEFGAYVSFDEGKRWQPLQQNLPGTPVTDIRVHRGDLVIATMGRSLWIMDDIAPLRQIARMSRGERAPSPQKEVAVLGSSPQITQRTHPQIAQITQTGIPQKENDPVSFWGHSFRPVDGGRQIAQAVQVTTPRRMTHGLPNPWLAVPAQSLRHTTGGLFTPHAFQATAPAARQDASLSGNVLFTPMVAWRTRYGAGGTAPDEPQYPAIGARIDYYFQTAPSGEVKVEILDAAGQVVRSFTAGRGEAGGGRGRGGGGGGDDPDMRGGGRGGGGGGSPTARAGHNRFVWPLTNAQNMRVVPGTYQVRVSAPGWSDTKPLEVKLDPRVLEEGITTVHLQELYDFQMKVLQSQAEARQLAQRIGEAREKATDPAQQKKLTALYNRLVTERVIYPQGMLIDQFSNIQSMIGGAEQRPGREAVLRYEDLVKELNAIKAEFGAP